MILMVTILMVFLRVVEPARASGTAAGPGSSFSSFSFRRARRRSAVVRGGDVLVGGGVGGGLGWRRFSSSRHRSRRRSRSSLVVRGFVFGAVKSVFVGDVDFRRGRGHTGFRALLLRVARGNGFRRVLRQCRRLYVPFVSTTTNILALVVTQLAAIVTVAG